MFLIPIVLIFIGLIIANLIPDDLGLGLTAEEEEALSQNFFDMKELAVLFSFY